MFVLVEKLNIWEYLEFYMIGNMFVFSVFFKLECI